MAHITAPDIRTLLGPLLPALPAASLSTQPAPALLPLLSPILRQRVRLFSESSTEPWIRLLSYDTGKAARLAEVARSDRLEPHPVSGEVEIDWDYDVETQYRRFDKETLQAFVVLQELEVFFRLLYCVNDHEGGSDGWRVAEISVPDKGTPFAGFDGEATIDAAEQSFREKQSSRPAGLSTLTAVAGSRTEPEAEDREDDEDDDDYWARYDATPARTPRVKRSPAPATTGQQQQQTYLSGQPHDRQADTADDVDDDDTYFNQYADVQPAMDNHDPDEVQHIEHVVPPSSATVPALAPLGLQPQPQSQSQSALLPLSSSASHMYSQRDHSSSSTTGAARSQADEDRTASLIHPRPASSASSNASQTIEKFEAQAGKQEQSEFGVKQHVSRSIRSLFLLSRAAGIDREEFESMVRTELDVLGMIEDEI